MNESFMNWLVGNNSNPYFDFITKDGVKHKSFTDLIKYFVKIEVEKQLKKKGR